MDQLHIEDLARSGLVAEDLKARAVNAPDLAAIKVPSNKTGYMIPYWNMDGTSIPFYRVKLFDHDLKYKQAQGTGNHVYFPRYFKDALQKRLLAGTLKFVLLTEGEKKAACAVKKGFPCVALGGVDSYKNRTLVLPADSEINPNYKEQGALKVKLPAGEVVGEESVVARGMQELVTFLYQQKIPLIIIYDTDSEKGTNFEVQRAAAGLGYQLVHMGMGTQFVRQVFLPFGSPEGKKVGLDDFLMHNGPEALEQLIQENLKLDNAFPRHPNIRAMINSKLQTGKLSRREIQELSLSVLSDLDCNGQRLRSNYDQTPYYFHKPTHTLMPAAMLSKGAEALHEGIFGTHLYRTYGIGGSDTKVMSWLATQFTGEDPITEVSPRKMITLTDDGIAVQISDSHFVTVTGDTEEPFKILTNGSKGILFEQGHVKRTDELVLAKELAEQNKVEKLECTWLDIFQHTVNFNDTERGTTLAAMLYYLSPWLRRWNNMQLPVEILIGEAGSGKSSLYQLRLSILTGNAMLRNLPQDVKDWYSSISSVGGLHVIDNVKFTNKEIRQKLSDEICRIITEPDPHIELRKLYTTSDVYRVPVNVIFAMTAIAMPFNANDIVQRAAIFKLNAVDQGNYDAEWVQNQLNKKGGRVGWLAHHLVAIHRFLKLAKTEWNPKYRSSHRLANYEQAMILMSKVFDLKADWIPNELIQRMQSAMTEADWVLDALKEFTAYALSQYPGGTTFSADTISNWAMAHGQHGENQILCNSRSLGKYMAEHAAILSKILNIKDQGVKGNKRIYAVTPAKGN